MEDGRDEEDGRFTQGNEFWRRALNAWGRKGPVALFNTSEELIEESAKYFADITDNPLFEEKVFNDKDDGIRVHECRRMRPMTIGGLCNSMGIAERTWRHYRDTREELQPAIEFIEQIIYQQKFEGAAAGFLNPLIIARDLGLADTTRIAGHDGGQLQTGDDWTDMERARRLAFVLAEAIQKQKENPDAETP